MLKECQSFLCTSPHSHSCLYTWMKSQCLGQLFWSQPNQSRYVESVLRKIQCCYVNSAFRGRTGGAKHMHVSIAKPLYTSSRMGKSLEYNWGWLSCMHRSWINCAWAMPSLLHHTHVSCLVSSKCTDVSEQCQRVWLESCHHCCPPRFSTGPSVV